MIEIPDVDLDTKVRTFPASNRAVGKRVDELKPGMNLGSTANRFGGSDCGDSSYPVWLIYGIPTQVVTRPERERDCRWVAESAVVIKC